MEYCVNLDYTELEPRIQEMSYNDLIKKRDHLFEQLQKEKDPNCIHTLRKKLRTLDHELDAFEEQPEPELSPTISPVEQVETLFKKGLILVQEKRGLWSFLLKGHPKAELARLIPQICQWEKKIENKALQKVVEKLRYESEKRWNKELYGKKFEALYKEWRQTRDATL